MPPRNRSKARADDTSHRKRVTGKCKPGIEKEKRSPEAQAGLPVSGTRSPVFRRVVRIHVSHPRLRVERRRIATLIHRLDSQAAALLNLAGAPPGLHPVPAGELSVAFLTDSALARLHATFLDDPSPTDVITFGGTPALGQAGEICVSVDTARVFAAGHRHDLSEELTLYVVHGWLHLAGHDDRQPDQKKRMRAAEARALALLRARRAIPLFTFTGWTSPSEDGPARRRIHPARRVVPDQQRKFT
jgi:probable rRNA maturation factor